MNPKAKVRPGWHYIRAQEAAFALEHLLAEHRIRIQPGSPLETHVLRVMKLVDTKDMREIDEQDDTRWTYRTLMGVHELSSVILEARESPYFSALLPHLELLSQGNALQNVPSRVTDQVTNKLFELFVGALAVQCGSDVELDHPRRSDGTNPDVMATFSGTRWGFACKVLHGSRQTFVERLEEGLDQLDRSPADTGVVVFNMRQTIPHDRIWPLAPPGDDQDPDLRPAAWNHPDAPLQELTNALEGFADAVDAHFPDGYLEGVFQGRKSVPGFLMWAHTASAVRLEGRPTPTSVRTLLYRSLAPISDDTRRVFACLEWAAHVGSVGRGSKPQA